MTSPPHTAPYTYRVREREAVSTHRELGQGELSAHGLVRKHAAESSPEHASRGLEVDGTLLGVGVVSLLEELGLLDLVSLDGAGHHDLLAAHHHDLLAAQELLGHGGGEATEQVALAIHHNGVSLGSVGNHLDHLEVLKLNTIK
jgi:hypothetical protein